MVILRICGRKPPIIGLTLAIYISLCLSFAKDVASLGPQETRIFHRDRTGFRNRKGQIIEGDINHIIGNIIKIVGGSMEQGETIDSTENKPNGDTQNKTEESSDELKDTNNGEVTDDSLGPIESTLPEVSNEVNQEEEIDVLASVVSEQNEQVSQVIRNLISSRTMSWGRGSRMSEEDFELRSIISDSANEYVERLLNSRSHRRKKRPHPLKVLHQVAPKIPAIQHSPDFMLRIRSARADLDSGIAACAIGAVASVTELYDKIIQKSHHPDDDNTEPLAAATEIISDRRFEQLVECLLCGVNVKMRLAEASLLENKRTAELGDTTESDVSNIDSEETKEGVQDDGVDDEHVKVSNDKENGSEGESALMNEDIMVADACRAAWGMSVLGVHALPEIGGEKPGDILVALALQSRELLLARLQMLQRADALYGSENNLEESELFELNASDLAHDAASAMWAFACVKECSGIQSHHLFDTCCSTLCQDEAKLRDTREKLLSIEHQMESVVDKLAKAEEINESQNDENEVQKVSSSNTNMTVTGTNVKDSPRPNQKEGSNTLLLDRLSPKEITNVIWALALHDSDERNTGLENEISSLTHNALCLRKDAQSRILDLLRTDCANLQKRQNQSTDLPSSLENTAPEKYFQVDASSGDIDEKSNPIDIAVKMGLGEETPALLVGLEMETMETSTKQLETVEVVDAAALLGSSGNDEVKLDTEIIITQKGGSSSKEDDNLSIEEEDSIIATETLRDQTGEEVQVIDAASILAAEAVGIPGEIEVSEEEYRLNLAEATEAFQIINSQSRLMDDALAEEKKSAEMDVINDDENDIKRSSDLEVTSPPSTKSTLAESDDDAELQVEVKGSFSSHDLCSIAWAATELRDPHCPEIVELVVDLLLDLGRDGMKDLEVHDLSNLAWAIARNPGKLSQSIKLSSWIASGTLIKMGVQHDPDDTSNNISTHEPTPHWLEEFEAPGLSRLLWSLASIMSQHQDLFSEVRKNDLVMEILAHHTLEAAGSNLDAFSIEDLARISWAFLELCDTTNPVLFQPRTAVYLGRIQATIESSLVRWENCQFVPKKQNDNLVLQSHRFTPFFGKARFSLPFIDHKIGVGGEFDDEDFGKPLGVKKSKLPALRDLSIDPQTLCKLAFGFSQLKVDQPFMNGNSAFLRIASRLFASKNGQLLNQCSNRDIVRLCYACARSVSGFADQLESEDRDFITKHFTRRVVQLLNDSTMETDSDQLAKSSILDDLSLQDLSAFIWSLGQLGVHCNHADEHPRVAYRKLRLIANVPVPLSDDIKTISPSSAVNLLCGIISLGNVSINIRALEAILLALRETISSLSHSKICKVSEVLAVLIQSADDLNEIPIASLHTSTDETLPNPEVFKEATTDPIDSEVEETAEIVSTLDKEEAQADAIVEILSQEKIERDKIKGLQAHCKALLSIVASEASNFVPQIETGNLQRILRVYATIPHQADAFIDIIETEVDARLAILLSGTLSGRQEKVGDLIHAAALTSLEAANKMSGKGLSLSNPFKNGLRALFEKVPQLDAAKDTEEDNPEIASDATNVNIISVAEDASEMVERSAKSIQKVATRVDRLKSVAIINPDHLISGIEDGTGFELGRCKELIASYRRIEFQTGTRRSRYERRKDIGKRILSRLFQ